MGSFALLLAALLLDALVGDPDWLWRRLPHPVVAFGAAIGFADRRFNREDASAKTRRRAGIASILGLLLASVAVGFALSHFLGRLGVAGSVLEIVLVAIFLAQRSLAEHVLRVARALRGEGLAAGRRAVSMIVGRSTEEMSTPDVSRAAIESLAENFSDGVVAPAFWYLVLGLPGLLAYKMLNTADSMIGHLDDRHGSFGWGAARLDDLANFLPARMSALFIALAGGRDGKPALALARTEAPRHRSPNAGWPEAAMAAACDVALGGPRKYGNRVASEPFLNAAGRADLGAPDIESAVSVFWRACGVQAVLVGTLALLSIA